MKTKITSRRVLNRAESERLTIAAFASILLHLAAVALLIIAVRSGVRPDVVAVPEPLNVPVEVILEPPAPQPTTASYIENRTDQESPTPPENPQFESNRNSVAASDRPATGSKPLPSMEGRDTGGSQLNNQSFSLGETPREDAVMGNAATASTATTKPPEKSASPAEKPEPQPTPVPDVTPDARVAASPEPQPTPPVSSPSPPPNALALLDPPIRRATRAELSTPPPATPPPDSATANRPPEPARPSRPGYQPELRSDRITGGINNRGRPSVNAIGTPLGRYKKMLSDAIGSRWYYYVNRQIDLVTIGTVEIHFVVDRNGKASGLRVTANSSNESFASISLRSILEAKIPPIPDEVAENLASGQLKVDYTFTILTN